MTTPGDAQGLGLHLALFLGSTHGRLGGLYWVVGTEHGLIASKASTLPAILSQAPRFEFFTVVPVIISQ